MQGWTRGEVKACIGTLRPLPRPLLRRLRRCNLHNPFWHPFFCAYVVAYQGQASKERRQPHPQEIAGIRLPAPLSMIGRLKYPCAASPHHSSPCPPDPAPPRPRPGQTCQALAAWAAVPHQLSPPPCRIRLSFHGFHLPSELMKLHQRLIPHRFFLASRDAALAKHNSAAATPVIPKDRHTMR